MPLQLKRRLRALHAVADNMFRLYPHWIMKGEKENARTIASDARAFLKDAFSKNPYLF